MKLARQIRFGLAALLIAAGAETSHAQVSAEQTMAIGRDLMAMEDYILAIQYFNQAIKAKPYMSDPYYLRGLSKMMLEDYTGAETDCSRAIARNQYKTEPYRIRGFCHLRLRQDSLALNDFNEGLKYAPMNRSFLYYKGIAESALGRHAAADSTFAYILRFNPKYTEARIAGIHNKLLANDTTAALRDIEATISSDRYSAKPYVIRSQIHADRQEWPEAIASLDKAIALDPKNAVLYVNRSIARAMNGDKKGALSDCAIALNINPEDKNASATNKMLLSETACLTPSFSDNHDLDIEHPLAGLKNTIKETSSKNDKYKPIGLFALTFTHPYTDIRPATNAYRELDALNTSHTLPSPLYLSHTPGDTPDAEQAVALFAYAENFDANPQSAMTYPHYMGRAVAFTMLKNYEAAIADINKAIALRPDLTSPLLQRAYLHIAMAEAARLTGRFRDPALLEAKTNEARQLALADLDAIIAIDPHMSYAWYDKGLILYDAADYTEAAHAFSKAIEINPDFAEAIFNRGLSYALLGDIPNAATDFSKAGELGVIAAYRWLKTLRQPR